MDMVQNALAQMIETRPNIPIYENYGSYKPKVNGPRIVSDLLETVPSKYLVGLGSIVLSGQTQLPRHERRKAHWSRGRKFRTSRVLGYYRGPWKGQSAFIELYIDKIYAGVPMWAARIPIVAFLVMAAVLFHEIGHHIHDTIRPEYKEKEAVADEWSKKLLGNAVRKQYRYVAPFLRPLARTALFFIRRFKHRDAQRA
jgi:hypothetical protein